MKKNLVLGMRLALPDFQRGGAILDFNPELTKDWEDSLKKYNYNYTLLKVNREDVNDLDGYNLGCIKMFKMLEYLKNNKECLNKVILSDVLDVRLLKSGLFEYMEDNTLYIGDEPNKLGINWVYENSENIFINEYYKQWWENNRNKQLLNTGLIGGEVEVVIDLLERICNILEKYGKLYDKGIDMFVLNYCVYEGSIPFVNGKPFNTEFKRYNYNNQECFLAHK